MNRDQMERLFETWIKLYQPSIYRFGCRSGLQPDDAEDLAQDCFRKAWVWLNRHGVPPDNVMALLHDSARKLLSDFWRKRARQRANFGQCGDNHQIDPPAESGHTERVRDAVNRLPDDERAVIDMRMLGYTQAETADHLGCSMRTVQRRESKARQQLHDDLNDR